MKGKWNRLDNAAKIFPSASSGSDTQVFRFSCELYETVEPELLQSALEEALEYFPVYQYILRRGFFWYYLDETELRPRVREEYKPPCSAIYDRRRDTLLYEVTYFGTHINLEVFHVLSDGTGVMHFLCTIVTKYLAKKYGFEEPVLDYDASVTQKADDSFKRYYEPEKGEQKKKQGFVYQLHGWKHPEGRMKLIRALLPVREVIEKAHEYGTTVTGFLAAVMLCSVYGEMTSRERKKPAAVVIPVNLRNFFESGSARNFFSVVFVQYMFDEGGELKEVAEQVDRDLKETLTKENMTKRLNGLLALEQNPFARIAPLFLKDICLKIAYRFSKFQSTVSLSNIGMVKLPETVGRYVRAFDVACATGKIQACVCSFEDRLSISFTSPFVSTDVQRRFFRLLTDMGIHAEISSNDI